MRRRDFVRLIAASAAAWPVAAHAQQRERVRRIGFLSNKRSDDPEGQNEVAAFVAALEAHGWMLGGNLQIDYRWGAGNTDLYRKYAVELVEQKPDLLLAPGGTVVGALQRATNEIPIVFVETTDPVDRSWSQACRGREARRQGSRSSISPSAANGWSCLRRLHQRLCA